MMEIMETMNMNNVVFNIKQMEKGEIKLYEEKGKEYYNGIH